MFVARRALRTVSLVSRTFSAVAAVRPSPAVAVVTPLDNPALSAMPLDADAEFLMGDSLETLLDHGDRLQKAEALLWIPPGDPAVLRELVHGGHLPNLRWAHGFYAGIDPIAAFAAEDLAPANVPLSNGRGAFSSSLAEYALYAAMHFVKQVPRCMENKRARRWDKFVMGEMRGLTMGFLGAGSIAQTTGRLAKAFGMRTVALRRNARKADGDDAFDLVVGPYDGPVLPAHKRALLEQSDVVVCTLPGTPETRHFVSTAEFGMMPAGCVFVSLGRGVAVDEAALDAALRAGRLGGAALDVFEIEPLPDGSPLWDDAHGERLLLTSHNADFTESYFRLGWDVWRQNLDRFVRDEPLATPVDTLAGY
jgi:phosphoglycerate dehydrogenase-like enzyme